MILFYSFWGLRRVKGAPEASEAPPPVSPTLTWRRVVTETLTLAWMETGRLGSEGVTSQSLRSSEVVRG